jgi:hypothetical protein
MTVNSGNFPKAMTKGATMKAKAPMKLGKTMGSVMKADKAADAKMTPKQMKSDISADRKLLASKLAKPKKVGK